MCRFIVTELTCESLAGEPGKLKRWCPPAPAWESDAGLDLELVTERASGEDSAAEQYERTGFRCCAVACCADYKVARWGAFCHPARVGSLSSVAVVVVSGEEPLRL